MVAVQETEVDLDAVELAPGNIEVELEIVQSLAGSKEYKRRVEEHGKVRDAANAAVKNYRVAKSERNAWDATKREEQAGIDRQKADLKIALENAGRAKVAADDRREQADADIARCATQDERESRLAKGQENLAAGQDKLAEDQLRLKTDREALEAERADLAACWSELRSVINRQAKAAG